VSLWRQVTGIMQPSRVVQVQTKTGETFRGLLVETNRTVFIMRAARKGTEDQLTGESWVPMLGDLVIPADNVDYWQEGLEAALLLD